MKKARRPSLALMAMPMLVLLALSGGCSDRDPAELDMARAPIDPLVFGDDYNDSFFQAFFETHVTAVEIDSVFAFGGLAQNGARSLKINVPPQGSSLGLFSGGVLTSFASRDLADFNALTFYARADRDITLDVAGYGNDNTGNSLYEAGRGGIPLTGEWSFVVVPIPAPSKLISERGMFTFAESTEEAFPEGYNIWVDDIRFANLGNVEVFRPTMRSVNRSYFVGSTVTVGDTRTVFDVDGGFVIVDHSPNYFDYESSDPAVAKVNRGQIQVVGTGSAEVTATVQGVEVLGTANITGFTPPSTSAPEPTLPVSDVVSLFSDVYPDRFVETWRADWGGSTTQLEDYVVAGDLTRMYSSLNFVGIRFENSPIDVSDMTHFHLDVYAPVGTDFKVKLVSFPPDLTAGVETPDLVLDADSTPAFEPGSWASLDIPLSDFELPEDWDWGNVGQLVLSTTSAQLVLLDNIYWYK